MSCYMHLYLTYLSCSAKLGNAITIPKRNVFSPLGYWQWNKLLAFITFIISSIPGNIQQNWLLQMLNTNISNTSVMTSTQTRVNVKYRKTPSFVWSVHYTNTTNGEEWNATLPITKPVSVAQWTEPLWSIVQHRLITECILAGVIICCKSITAIKTSCTVSTRKQNCCCLLSHIT